MSTATTILSGPEFHALDVTGWVHLVHALETRLETDDFATGLRLLTAIGEVAERLQHHPDLDLRYGYLDVRSSSHDVGGVTERDVDLAREVNRLAAEAGVRLSPRSRQRLEVGLDTDDFTVIKPFWNAVHGLPGDTGPEIDEVRVGDDQVPVLWFQAREHDSGQRFHLDLWVHPDEVEARIAAATAAGGRLVTDAFAPSFWVLCDPEGNQVCLCTWQDRNSGPQTEAGQAR